MSTLTIAHTWDGARLHPDERATVRLCDAGDHVRLSVRAPFEDDPPPPGPPGPTPGLWHHEVVECFLAGADGSYLEVELGPHGHHLVLSLSGVRQVVWQARPLDVRFVKGCHTWTAEARIPLAWLPPRPWTANAYRIHGVGAARVYHAHAPLPGAAPDFHQPAVFPPLPPLSPCPEPGESDPGT